MIRRIIRIDEQRCNGCGLCATACHEGAIEMVNGKAVLTKENHCDGLGDCLPACPTGAITFEEREAPAYDHAAVLAAKQKREHDGAPPAGCPGCALHTVQSEPCEGAVAPVPSRLRQWPVQLKLVPPTAPWFDDAQLLVAADCTAYAYGGFHEDFMRDHITLIGCPKLDEGDYTEKLTAIFANNVIRSVTVTRMEVPCCGGLERAVLQALDASGRAIPWRVVTISSDGKIID